MMLIKAQSSLTRVQGIGYSSGNFGKNILWNTLEFCLLYLLTDVMLIDPATAGLIITLSIVWDGLLDPFLGYFADRVSTPLGKYGPFILLGSPFSSLLFIAIFWVPLIEMDYRLGLMVTCLLLFRTFYTVVDIPHNALLARIVRLESDRSQLAGLRFFFSCIASMVIALALAPILGSATPHGEAVNFLRFSIVAGILSTLFVCWSWWSVRTIDIGLTQSQPVKILPIRALPGITKSRYLLALFAIIFLTGLTTPLFTKVFLYYAKYSIGMESMGSFGLFIFMAGSGAGSFMWIWVARKYGSKWAMTCSHGLLFAAATAFFILRPEKPLMLAATVILIGFAAAGAYLLIWVLASSAVDDVESRTGNRFEATVFALLILAMKIAIGLGSFIAGLLLKEGGYQALEIQTPATEFIIRLTMCGIPAMGSLAIVGILTLPAIRLTHHAKTTCPNIQDDNGK